MSITIIAKLKAKAGTEKQFEDAARKIIDAVRASEPGTLHYVLHRSMKDPTEFTYYEVYADQDAADVHRRSDHMKAFGVAIAALLDGRPQIDILTEVVKK